MLVKDIKPIGKVGKNLLKNQNAEEIIKKIIEEPLKKACIECYNKNIETIMSSANKKNIVTKKITKKDVLNNNKMQTFEEAGKGYAWIMLNYNTLSDINRQTLFSLEQELGEDTIWFVKSNYIEFVNSIRKHLKFKELSEPFDDKYADTFKEKQLKLMYNNKYPRRVVIIRMAIDETTKTKDVEDYFHNIIVKLEKQ